MKVLVTIVIVLFALNVLLQIFRAGYEADLEGRSDALLGWFCALIWALMYLSMM